MKSGPAWWPGGRVAQNTARSPVSSACAALAAASAAALAAAQVPAAMGLPLSQEALVALVLVAALPSASNVSLLTERFGAHGGRVARIILVSTALAFVTFSAAVTWLAPHP